MALIPVDHICRTCHEAARSQALIPDPTWDKTPRNTRVVTLAAVDDYLHTPALTDQQVWNSLSQTGKVDTNHSNPGTKANVAPNASQLLRVQLYKAITDSLR